MTEGIIDNSAKKLTNAALIFFAAVGFIASVVTVLTYLNPSEISSLRVTVTPGYFRIPEYTAGLGKSDSTAKKLVDDMAKLMCKDFDRNSLAGLDDAAIAAMKFDSKKHELAINCRDINQAEFMMRWSAAFADDPSTLYRYSVENDGTKIAQRIRLSSESVNAVQIRRGSKYANIDKGTSGDSFPIPDLNPKEQIDLIVWTNLESYRDTYWDTDGAPKVTFSGSNIHTEFMRYVPDGWWGIYDFFETMPIVLIIIFVVVIAMLVTFGSVLAISIPIALITGKPIGSIFETEKPVLQQ